MVRESKRKRAELYVHDAEEPLMTRTFELSADRRRVRTTYGSTRQVSSPSANYEVQESSATSIDLPLPSMAPWEETAEPSLIENEVPGVTVLAKPKTRRFDSTAAPLQVWLKHRQEYVNECLRLEGRGAASAQERCYGCENEPSIRCRDCTGGVLGCRTCVLASHTHNPLHVLEAWRNDHFEEVTLQELGLEVQLGHPQGQQCPTRVTRELVVLHVNGIHKVNVLFCTCNTSLEYRQQLLRYSWWPATPTDPHTCATVAVLRLFHTQNLQGNITAYDFYRALENMTDSRKLRKLPDRLQQFMLMIRQWRNCKVLKRRGQAHQPGGIEVVMPGALAMPCRACPHPGVNLPERWQEAPPCLQFLYWLFVAQDANFRVKNRHRPSTYIDVCLSPGWAYFVETGAYLAHVTKFATQEEISTCAGFLTMALANLKKAKGLSSTGIGGCACTRHEIWRPNGIGDLQRGERYCNMDYILSSSIVAVSALVLVVSYDIACQFFKNFFKRMEALPPRLQCKLPPSAIKPKVPKLHLESHEEVCHGPYSFNYTPGAGRSDGEGIERLWAWLNKAAPSVKEMGPSARRETVDDFCGYSAWRKTVGLCDLLTKRMLEALKESDSQEQEFRAFDAALRREHPDLVDGWEEMVLQWEKDHSLPCPYRSSQKKVTMTQVQLELAREEEKRAAIAAADITTVDSSPSSPGGFVMFGLDIEKLQTSLKDEISRHPKVSALCEANRLEQRATIRKKLAQFREMQSHHMPGLSQLLRTVGDNLDNASQQAEEIPLYFPSQLPEASRTLALGKTVADVEDRLRFAQAYEALDDLRQQLRARMFINRFKMKNITGQRKNTRARSWQKAIDDKALAAKYRYRHARQALINLRGHGTWEESLQELTDDDVRSVNERAMTMQEKEERRAARQAGGRTEEEVDAVPVDQPSQVGEGHRTISWIWYRTGVVVEEADEAMNEAVRIEWAKSRARAMRWTEETILLDEEMRRSVVFCKWEALQWEQRAAQARNRSDITEEVREGLIAYAQEQAQAEHKMAELWATKFAPLRAAARRVSDSWMQRHGSNVNTFDPDPSNAAPIEDKATTLVEVTLGELDDYEDDYDMYDL